MCGEEAIHGVSAETEILLQLEATAISLTDVRPVITNFVLVKY